MALPTSLADTLLASLERELGAQPRLAAQLLGLDASAFRGQLPEEYASSVRDLVVQALADGLATEVGQHLDLTNFDCFADGGVSPLVGKLEVGLAVAIKAGGAELKSQLLRMRGSMSPFWNILPSILGVRDVEVNSAGSSVTLCLLELVSGRSLLRMAYDADSSARVVREAIASVFGTLSPIYKSSASGGSSIGPRYCYLERLDAGITELVRWSASLADNEKAQLVAALTRPLVIDETVETPSIAEMLDDLKAQSELLEPPLNFCCHGDLNAGNLLVDGNVVRAIDPSPLREFDHGDFIYDFGKLLSSFVGGGSLALYRNGEAEIVVEAELRTSKVHVQTDVTHVGVAPGSVLESAARDVRDQCGLLAGEYRDSGWRKRLHAAVASSFLGSAWRFGDLQSVLYCIARAAPELMDAAGGKVGELAKH